MYREIPSNAHQRGCPAFGISHPRAGNKPEFYKPTRNHDSSSNFDEEQPFTHTNTCSNGNELRQCCHQNCSSADTRCQSIDESPTLSRPSRELATLRRAYAIDTSLEYLRTQRMRTAYAVPMDEYHLPRRSLTRLRGPEFPHTSPLVYHSVVSADIPRDMIDFQGTSLLSSKDTSGALDLSLKKYPPHPSTEKASSSNIMSSSKKVPKQKMIPRRVTPPKWKKAYNKAVKSHKDDVGLVLLGPNGPVLYAKVIQARRLPSSVSPLQSFSNQGTDSGISQDPIKGPGGDASEANITEGNSGSADLKSQAPLPKDNHNLGDPDEMQKETDNTIDTTWRKSPKGNQIELKLETSKELASQGYQNTKGDESSGSWRVLQCPRSDNSTKKIYRAKKIERSTRISRCSSKSRTTDPDGDKVTNWLKKDIDYYKDASLGSSSHQKEQKRSSSDERKRMLQEAIPSIAAGSREEHLKQLKQCIGSFVDYLEAKSDADSPNVETSNVDDGKTDDNETVSTVRIDTSKLIDIVNNPLRRIASDLTVTVTQSVTDALVGTDSTTTEPPVLKSMKKMRDKHFQKVQQEVQKLFQLVRLIDSVSGSRRTTN